MLATLNLKLVALREADYSTPEYELLDSTSKSLTSKGGTL